MESHVPPTNPGATPDDSALYDEAYYENCYQGGTSKWRSFFGDVADNIVRSLSPATAYDAGCGTGLLVEALWDRGVETYGRDISEFAINQVRPDVRNYCSIGSITDPIEGVFDLMLCIEVLEHLTQADADLAIKRLTTATSQILFSSSPIDFDEPTHINVRPPIYWVRQFASHGFLPVTGFDATFVCPQAMLFRKSDEPIAEDLLAGAAEMVRLRVSLEEVTVARNSLNERLAAALEAKSQLESAEAVGSQELRAARRALTEERELAAATTQHLEAQVEVLQRQLSGLKGHAEALDHQLKLIQANVFWRATAPIRRSIEALPRPVRRLAQRILKVLWRSLKPGGGRVPVPVEVPAAVSPSPHPAPSGPAALSIVQPFPFLEPLRVFPAPPSRPTVNIVTDSIRPGSLFGGVATALILGSQIAKRVDGTLRIVTRTEPGDAADVARLLRNSSVTAEIDIETLHVGEASGAAVPVSDRDYFIATSWWTAGPTVTAVGYDRFVYLLQEDERLFYPMGDLYLRCAEILGDPRMNVVINSEMLYNHLTASPATIEGLAERSVYFEPAFPSEMFYEDPSARAESGKLNFLFYARPNNLRNLYWRGLESIERSLLDGVLDPDRWRFMFLGKDIKDIKLPGDPEVTIGENLTWDEYARHVRTAHVGLSLVHSPHPSYPPLDLAASGAVVVTNRFGSSKLDLSSYSRNIFCVEPTVANLVDAIGSAVALAADPERRAQNSLDANIARDWSETLAPVVERIVEWCDPQS